MNISYKWLKEYVDFDLTAQQVGRSTEYQRWSEGSLCG